MKTDERRRRIVLENDVVDHESSHASFPSRSNPTRNSKLKSASLPLHPHPLLHSASTSRSACQTALQRLIPRILLLRSRTSRKNPPAAPSPAAHAQYALPHTQPDRPVKIRRVLAQLLPRQTTCPDRPCKSGNRQFTSPDLPPRRTLLEQRRKPSLTARHLRKSNSISACVISAPASRPSRCSSPAHAARQIKPYFDVDRSPCTNAERVILVRVGTDTPPAAVRILSKNCFSRLVQRVIVPRRRPGPVRNFPRPGTAHRRNAALPIAFSMSFLSASSSSSQ